MARAAERLPARTAQTVKEPSMYADDKGLYLRIGPTDAKSWIGRYRNAGIRRSAGANGRYCAHHESDRVDMNNQGRDSV
jgi:hypothetical protein